MNKDKIKSYIKANKKNIAIIAVSILPVTLVLMVVCGVASLFYGAIKHIHGEILEQLESI